MKIWLNFEALAHEMILFLTGSLKRSLQIFALCYLFEHFDRSFSFDSSLNIL